MDRKSILNPEPSEQNGTSGRMSVSNMMMAPKPESVDVDPHGHLRRSNSDSDDSIPPSAPAPMLMPEDSQTAPDVAAEPPTTEPQRPYKCPLCEKAFHRLEHQTRHIRTHTGEKPHACAYPGCPKRFSRSDELTRHSRIHSNPNSRRGNKSAIAASHHHMSLSHSPYQQGYPPQNQQPPPHLMPAYGQQPILHHPQQPLYHQQQPLHDNPGSGSISTGTATPTSSSMLPPPMPARAIRSAPTSTVASPDVSPPHSFTAHHLPIFARSPAQHERDGQPSYQQQQHQPPRAANFLPHIHGQPLLGNHRAHLSALHVYGGSSIGHKNPASEDMDDHYNNYRQAKRSRPNSPNSTAPSSPTLSHDSLSPTPDYTPLATPAHSPRLRPYGYELPSLRSLSLQQPLNVGPTLPPIDSMAYDNSSTYLPPPNVTSAPRASSSTHISLTSIINQPEPSQRILPPPKMDALSADRYSRYPGGES